MEFRELAAFYHVARLRSVTGAAEHLQIGQPAVSSRLKKLEDDLSVQLIDRVKRPVQLTSDGKALYDLVKPLVEGLELVRTQMEHSDEMGAFALGVYPDLALHYLPGIIKEFKDRYPGVHINLLTVSYSALIDMVSNGEVDLALAHRPGPAKRSLNYTELFRSDFALIAPLGHELLTLPRVDLADIARWPLITMGSGSYTRHTIEQSMTQAGMTYEIALELTTVEMVQTYVEIGMGVSVVSEFTLRPGIESRLGVLRLGHLFPSSRIGIITLKDRTLGRAVNKFVDVLVGQRAPVGRAVAPAVIED